MEDRNPLPGVMLLIAVLATAFAVGVYFRRPEPAVAQPQPPLLSVVHQTSPAGPPALMNSPG
jgi:hypothetical protein